MTALAIRQRTWLAYENAMTAEDCAAVAAMMPAATPPDTAGLVDGRAAAEIRRTRVHWLAETPETAWIYERLTGIIARANREVFHFALDGFEEDAQIGGYDGGGFYDWHVDRGGRGVGARRKLTVSVQLTAAEAYDGGALEINPDGRPVVAPRAQGTAVVFPAFALHRVTPVTRGLRHSLVLWTHGPNFV
jgi:PKHD-type hydroxylase